MAASPEFLNVFKGRDSLAQYLDPDLSPPLPLVEIPNSLNPLRGDGVRIFAKMLTALPAQNVKSLPALAMLRSEPNAHQQTIVEASSGSTVLSLAILARALWGHDDVHAYVTNKKHPDSLRLMKFFGLKTVLFGGLAQQEPSDPRGVMARLRKMANTDPGVCYPGQYGNDENWKAHERWTGAQIWRQLPEVNVFCATVGTGGCVTGTGAYLKAMKPSVRTIGVCSIRGDPIPGPRYFSGFETSPFPWQENIDVFQDVCSADAFRASMQLSRHGLICGPSSGQALCGVIAHLQAAKAAGNLAEYADPATNEINAVFVCADLPYQYMDLYFNKIPKEELPPTFNENLLSCDLDPYDERNCLTLEQVFKLDGGALKLQPCAMPSSCCCNNKDRHHQQHQRQYAPPPSPPPSSSGGESPHFPHTPDAPTSLPLPTPPDLLPISLPLTTDINSSENGDSYNCNHDVNTSTATTTRIIDIRPQEAYTRSHMHNAWNIPLTPEPQDLFGDAQAVEARWREMRDVIEGPLWPTSLARVEEGEGGRGRGTKVLVLCGNGDSSRMMVAMLRARGVEAFSVEGGYEAWE
ncbi:tryptophan synthase beta subunit-like PLP-dependent enzyme [Cercophora newfieldiana]|uniref:Tryptophan synthase beta subunit-like PLP-dependent enzyme n=1 Tax=Cercophora newfieldiana TaxID=92897 RepID=A0AA40CY79_9PEZI|nr:tryptophan synthase beta subunit-like PLP-dependent enzyme [Cercophora newfieldiana]